MWTQQILDAGRTWSDGDPPQFIRFGNRDVPNFARRHPPQTILGAEQKKGFLDRLETSQATWKIWGNSLGTLDQRADPQNLPQGLTKPWPGTGFAGFGGGDFGTAYVERGEIYEFVKKHAITGFATVAGDRHSFWAGLASKSLDADAFDPVGIAFITGSISAPGMVEAIEHHFPKEHPLRPLFLYDPPDGSKPHPAVNMLMRHGVRSCLALKETGDVEQARRQSHPALSPHLSFVDMGGHGYAAVRVTPDVFETEFVCIPRPLERSTQPDGGPLIYRVIHRARMWKAGTRPVLEQQIVEGNPELSI